MKNYIYYLSALFFLFILLTAEIENGGGSIGGKTGSPGDNGSTCTE